MKFLRPTRATEWRPKAAHGKTLCFGVKAGQALEKGERNIRQSIFYRPFRDLKFFSTPQPTVPPWATSWRVSGAMAAMIFFFAAGAMAKTTNDFVEAIIQGRNLAQQLLEQCPAESFTNAGVLKIRDGKGNVSEVPIKCEIILTTTNWQSVYEAFFTNTTETLTVTHLASIGGGFDLLGFRHEYPTLIGLRTAFPDNRLASFASSDFMVADLGLEFFHWPGQKVLPKTTNLKRGREYTLLESTNPDPSTNGYSRVLSCIDKETGGILEAEAFDAKGELLKVFEPKSFKKVNGQWELQEMEIRNVQTGSRTRLEFDLKK
jgi:hypothetical protein